ncbi:hypothetical protein F3I62_01255 [Pseudomonas sp. R-28-1W-6]|jgi:hypothetical protein|uniref:hypothetical protein n=1 Tax=Pseudomonas sp. R-28-1W-6 TaxID=2650101 RepID=UPI00136585D7|nr:hypothetical protein [Pseudomonas sp. R-28-1W-6]MWV10706.1 hypothetical protein [Pseudomonas sp. R-28-1W-6]
MQVSGYSGNLPLSTQIINKAGQATASPEVPLTAEQVNRTVDRAADRVAEQQDSQTLGQSNRRSAATQLYSATSQQRQIDTYLAVASEGEIDSQPGAVGTALQLRDDARRNQLAQDIASNTRRVERPEAKPVAPEAYRDTRA